jgi:hypothetical protein
LYDIETSSKSINTTLNNKFALRIWFIYCNIGNHSFEDYFWAYFKEKEIYGVKWRRWRESSLADALIDSWSVRLRER